MLALGLNAGVAQGRGNGSSPGTATDASFTRRLVSVVRRRGRRGTPALRAAGLEHRPPYALRHSFAAWSIAAGTGLFERARMMGTSVEQIDRTYGHLLPDSIDRARAALEAFGHGAAGAAEVGGELR